MNRATDGAVPTAIDHGESESFLLGKGDIPGAIGVHFKKDASHQKATRKMLGRLFWYANVAGLALIALGYLGQHYGPDIVRLLFKETVTPIVEAQSKATVETVRASLSDFRASVDKDRAVDRAASDMQNRRIDRLEARRR